MSLKAFHIVFITASSALAFGCSVWALRNYFGGGSTSDLAFGVVGLLVGAGLIVYEGYFLKKMKKAHL